MPIKKQVVENYRDYELLIMKFHEFISMVFPNISFKEWYLKGFWTENYIPFSIIESGKIISSASAAIMEVIYQGQNKKAIQIGAVGTLPECRNQGLSRLLMDHIINKYEDDVDFFFLHANETVLEFYPKFSFRSIKENSFEMISNIPKPTFSARKLNIDDKGDYSLLIKLISNRKLVTKLFGAKNYTFITMWHIINLYKNNLFYLEKEELVVIKNEKADTMYIVDVIFGRPFNFNLVLPNFISSDSIKSIKYYFPPDQLKYNYDKIVKEDTGLFILGNLELENMQFRYPETAVT